MEYMPTVTTSQLGFDKTRGFQVINRPWTMLKFLDKPEWKERIVEDYDVRTPSIQTTVQSLSGGNKQKVVIARELAADPRLLIASQPTRGVDVGSIEFIHSQIVKARDGGAGVLLISAELDEVMGLSDRILVMYDGRVVAELDGEGADRNRIGRLMAGGEDTPPSSADSA